MSNALTQRQLQGLNSPPYHIEGSLFRIYKNGKGRAKPALLVWEFPSEAQPVGVAFWGCKDSSAGLRCPGQREHLTVLCSVISLFSDKIFLSCFGFEVRAHHVAQVSLELRPIFQP